MKSVLFIYKRSSERKKNDLPQKATLAERKKSFYDEGGHSDIKIWKE